MADLVDHAADLGRIVQYDASVHLFETHPLKNLLLIFGSSNFTFYQCDFQLFSHVPIPLNFCYFLTSDGGDALRISESAQPV